MPTECVWPCCSHLQHVYTPLGLHVRPYVRSSMCHNNRALLCSHSPSQSQALQEPSCPENNVFCDSRKAGDAGKMVSGGTLITWLQDAVGCWAWCCAMFCVQGCLQQHKGAGFSQAVLNRTGAKAYRPTQAAYKRSRS